MNATDLVSSPSSRRIVDENGAANELGLLINGKLVKGVDTLDVINPATGRKLMTVPRADRAQLDQAVATAKAAFTPWSATPLPQRGALLVKLAEALEAEQDDFARKTAT